jgi:capsule polysaccharide export protein KpsE/RkpR
MNDMTPDKGAGHLLDFLIIFAKHSRMIIFVSAMVIVLTYLVLFMRPNNYTTTARLLPPQQNLTLSGQILDSMGGGSFTRGGGGAGGGLASLLGLKSPGDLYVGMMTGHTVLDRIIARFNLMKIYKVKYIDDARKTLSNHVKIGFGRKDNIITIQVASTSPERAAKIANAFGEELGQLLQELSLQEAKGRLTFLEKERLQTSQNLTKAEEALRGFSEKNSVLQLDTQTRGALEYIARLRAEIDSKEVNIQVLRQQATPFNYDVVRLETEIKGLKEKLRGVECQYDSSQSDVCLPTNKTPGLTLEYVRLYRETKFQESLYKLYIKLVEIAKMDMARDIAVIQMIDIAKPPEKRSNKRLGPSILAGIIMFFMMTFVAFGLEYVKNMNIGEDDAQQLSVLNDYLKPWRNMLTRMKTVLHFKK